LSFFFPLLKTLFFPDVRALLRRLLSESVGGLVVEPAMYRLVSLKSSLPGFLGSPAPSPVRSSRLEEAPPTPDGAWNIVRSVDIFRKVWFAFVLFCPLITAFLFLVWFSLPLS